MFCGKMNTHFFFFNSRPIKHSNFPGPREQKQSETLAQIQKDLSTALAVDLNNSEHLDTWPTMIHRYFEKHETLFLEAVGAGFGEGGGGNIWTYPGCILFSVSLLTTLGKSIFYSCRANRWKLHCNHYIEQLLYRNLLSKIILICQMNMHRRRAFLNGGFFANYF